MFDRGTARAGADRARRPCADACRAAVAGLGRRRRTVGAWQDLCEACGVEPTRCAASAYCRFCGPRPGMRVEPARSTSTAVRDEARTRSAHGAGDPHVGAHATGGRGASSFAHLHRLNVMRLRAQPAERPDDLTPVLAPDADVPRARRSAARPPLHEDHDRAPALVVRAPDDAHRRESIDARSLSGQ